MRCPLHVIAVLLLFFVSCRTENGEKSEKATEEAGFVPNPQPVAEQDVTPLDIGAQAPDFHLIGTDGKWYTLEDFELSKILVVLFTCNHCPTAQAYEDRIIQVVNDYGEKDVAFVAISPNSPLGLLYGELGYTDLDDSYESMQIRARDKGYNFPYLYDGDTEEASIKYGPEATPHAFVFNQDRLLAYRGRLDGNEKPGTGNAEDLRAALDELLADKEVSNSETRTFGCSTKWAWNTEWKERVYAEWDQRPVELHTISVDGLREMIANPSDKLRLINVWATWCGSCIVEYPELLVTHRMYQGRDFEFISLSADNPEHHDEALEFLNKVQSPITNYIFDQDDPYLLADTLDPEWNAALPYTMLIEPGGKVVYKHQGMVDILELRRVIVEHEMMGRYY